MGMTRLLTAVLILLVLPGSTIAQITEIQELPDQLIGTWIGILPDPELTRIMQIQEVKSAAPDRKDVFEAKGMYGITGKKMLPVSITIAAAEGKFQLSFITSAKSKILLTLATAASMDGTFITAKGKEMRILFKKDGQMPMTDPALSGRTGASNVTSSNPIKPEKQPSKQPILRIESGMHTAMINSIGLDADNRYLVTASQDKTVGIWDVKTGKLIRKLRPPIGEGREGVILAVAISPDGTTIVAGGSTGAQWDKLYSIYIFDRHTGGLIKRINGVSSVINHLTFSKDGKYLAACLGGLGGINSGLRVYSTAGYSLTGEDKDYGNNSRGADFAQSDRLVTTSYDGFIRLYSMESGSLRLVAKEKGRGGSRPHSVSFSPSASPLETKIAVGYDDSTKLDVLSGRDLSYLYSPDTTGIYGISFYSVAWASDGISLYAGGRYGGADQEKPIFRWSRPDKWLGSRKVLRAATNSIMHILPLNNGGIAFGAFDPAFGIINENDERTLFISPNSADFREKEFLTSHDGLTVQFGYETFGRSSAIFSTRERRLDTGFRTLWSGLKPPITQASDMNITDWKAAYAPKLNGKELKLNQRETSRSLAIAPSEEGFLLGTESRLRFFDRTGTEKWQVYAPSTTWAVNISGNGKIASAAFADGTVRWYRMSDGKELLALFPHKDGKRWVMWTPEGYFDASPGGAELIGYHINQGKDKEARFVSMNNLYDVFYRPDIVQAKMRGDDIREMFTLTAEAALIYPPPTVKIADVPAQTDQGKIKVCYQVASSGGGIGEVRLFHNGKLIQSDGYYKRVAQSNAHKTQLTALNSRAIYEDMRSISIKGIEEAIPTTSKSKGDVFDDCTEVEVVPGENEVSVTAFNSTNTVQSYMETVNFNSTMKPEDPHLYILAIGIDQYQDNKVNLKYAVKDAKDIEEKLKGQAATLYKPANIYYTLLTDRDAIKTNISDKINELSQVIKPNDSFVLFVAGHGVLLQNQYHMLTHDYNGVVNDNSVISSNEIVEMSKKVKSLSQLLIFDTCHAGGVDYLVSGLYDARMSVLAKKMGLHIYASASDKQTAMDGYKGNGLFTHTLLSGLNNKKEADANNDGAISLVELGGYSKQATADISREVGHSQTPLIINFGRDNPIYKLQ